MDKTRLWRSILRPSPPRIKTKQDNSVDHQPLNELTNINSVNAATIFTLFLANYSYCPEIHYQYPKESRLKSERLVNEGLKGPPRKGQDAGDNQCYTPQY